MNDDTPGLGSALRDRVRHEEPDLDRLIDVSTRLGTRLRRRRQLGVALVGTAGIAAVAVGVAALQGSGSAATDRAPVASEPTTAAPVTLTPTPSVPLGSPTPTQNPNASARSAPESTDPPMRIGSPGWTCAEPAGGEFTCTKDGVSVLVAWHPAPERIEHLDPAPYLEEGVTTFVSRVHGNWFVTVAPGPGTTQAEIDEVRDSIVWESM